MKRLLVLLMLLGWQESVFSQAYFNAKCIVHYNYLGKGLISTIHTKTYVYPGRRTSIDVSNTEREAVYYANFQLMASTDRIHYFGFPLDSGISSNSFSPIFNSNYANQQSHYCGPYNFPGHFVTRSGFCQPYIFQSNFAFSERDFECSILVVKSIHRWVFA